MIQFATQSACPGHPVSDAGMVAHPRQAAHLDVLFLAQAVDHFGRGQGEETLTALAWVMLNRHAISLASSLASSVDSSNAFYEEPVSTDFARALVAVADACSGREADPTNGSTRFHHHRENPQWANEHQLQAIAGPFLFYSQRV